MSPEFTLRPIRPQECSHIVALHRAAFPAEEVKRTIYGCPHPERYLASLIAFPTMQREHILEGVWEGKELIGYVHLRLLREALHLNYIAVLPEYQGRGVGRTLWGWCTDHARKLHYKAISLDVSQKNSRALAWYHRKGFKIIQRTWVYEKSLQSGSGCPAEVSLLDWDDAEAWQAYYGFSQFHLVYQDKTWSIGRLGLLYFRMSERPPEAIETTLTNIDPDRSLLIVSPTQIQDNDFIEVGITLRMYGPS